MKYRGCKFQIRNIMAKQKKQKIKKGYTTKNEWQGINPNRRNKRKKKLEENKYK